MDIFEKDRLRADAETARIAELPMHQTQAFTRELKKVQAANAPTLLTALKTIAHNRDQCPRTLVALTGIKRPRIAELMNAVGQAEPWLDEAVILHRALGTPGVLTLMNASATYADSPLGHATRGDLDAYRAGLRLPLSLACRLAIRFGLDDPSELIVSARHMEIWSVLETSLRLGGGEGPAVCPWCLASADARGENIPHLDTCLPNNLWGPRNVLDAKAIGFHPRPLSGRNPNRRGYSKKAYAVRDLRKRLNKTQQQMATDIGMDANYLSRIERGDVPLRLAMAERIAAAYRVTVESIYAEPDEETTVPPAPGARGGHGA